MGLHAKHNPLDALVHRLLTWLMLGCAATMAAEVWVRGSTLLALAKTLLVFLQGTWFWHVGRILYLGGWGGVCGLCVCVGGGGDCPWVGRRKGGRAVLCTGAGGGSKGPGR
jgi:hypothetical protein